jgi:hypothetical protein
MGKLMPRARFLIIVCELGSIETLKPALYLPFATGGQEASTGRFCPKSSSFVGRSFPYRPLRSSNPLASHRTLGNSSQPNRLSYRLAIHCNTGEKMQEMQSGGCIFGIWERGQWKVYAFSNGRRAGQQRSGANVISRPERGEVCVGEGFVPHRSSRSAS